MVQKGNRIILPNRYRNKNSLIAIGENKYKLETDPKNNFVRVSFDRDVNLSIDLEGGPYMHVGEMVPGIGKLVSITEEDGFILHFDL